MIYIHALRPIRSTNIPKSIIPVKPPTLIREPTHDAWSTSTTKFKGVCSSLCNLANIGDSHPRAIPWVKTIIVTKKRYV